MFAEKYLQKQNRETLIHNVPDNNLGAIVVIPCINEPDILQTLISINNCTLPSWETEVIVVINHSENSDEEIKEANNDTKRAIEKWINTKPGGGVKFYVVGPIELRKKWAGAGVARKTGMDEAIRRFNILDKPDGIIISLDADTNVEQNYLVEIERYFTGNTKSVGATISFQHQTSGLNKKHLEGIQLYEKYLWYYKNALIYTGYPFSMFTIGSAFVVTAGAYVKRGGMNRRQAGEDFYFLQNLVQIGKVGEIQSTRVYPSARLSDRVPFGTGPVLKKWMNGEEDLKQTYNFQAFIELNAFFQLKEKLFKIDKSGFDELLKKLSESIREFIREDNFWKELDELNQNCSSLISFQNRFFQKFNAFKILKYLNFAHQDYYKKVDLLEQIIELEKMTK